MEVEGGLRWGAEVVAGGMLGSSKVARTKSALKSVLSSILNTTGLQYIVGEGAGSHDSGERVKDELTFLPIQTELRVHVGRHL